MVYDPDEDDPHVGTFGQVWFKHPYDVEEDEAGERYRAYCACGWHGNWFPHPAPANAQGEDHPLTADFNWTSAPGQHRNDDVIENAPGVVVAACAAFVLVAALVVAWYLLLWRR